MSKEAAYWMTLTDEQQAVAMMNARHEVASSRRDNGKGGSRMAQGHTGRGAVLLTAQDYAWHYMGGRKPVEKPAPACSTCHTETTDADSITIGNTTRCRECLGDKAAMYLD